MEKIKEFQMNLSEHLKKGIRLAAEEISSDQDEIEISDSDGHKLVRKESKAAQERINKGNTPILEYEDEFLLFTS